MTIEKANREFAIAVNKDNSKDAVMYCCSSGKERVFNKFTAAAADWYLVEGNEVPRRISAPVSCTKVISNGVKRIMISTPAICLEETSFYPLVSQSNPTAYFYSPLLGRIARTKKDRIAPGTLVDLKAMWLPPETVFFRWLRDYEGCFFLCSNEIIKIVNPVDHYYLKSADYIEMRVTEKEGSIAKCVALDKNLEAMVYVLKSSQVHSDVSVLLFPLNFLGSYTLFVGREYSKLPRKYSEEISYNPQLDVILIEKEELNVLEQRKVNFSVSTPWENNKTLSDLSSEKENLSMEDWPEMPKTEGKKKEQLEEEGFQVVDRKKHLCNSAPPDRDIILLPLQIYSFKGISQTKLLNGLVVSTDQLDNWYCYCPDLPFEICLSDVDKKLLKRCDWVQFQLDTVFPHKDSPKPQRAFGVFCQKLDRADPPYDVKVKPKNNTVSVNCKITVPDDFHPGKQDLVTSNFVPRIVADNLKISDRGKTLQREIVRCRDHVKINQYPEILWIVDKYNNLY